MDERERNNNYFKIIGDTNEELKTNFVNEVDLFGKKEDKYDKKIPFRIGIKPDTDGYWGEYLSEGDSAINWIIFGTLKKGNGAFDGKEVSLYRGKALMKEGKVVYYDRYPCGGGPFKPTDFNNKDFRERTRIICDNLEKIIANYQKK